MYGDMRSRSGRAWGDVSLQVGSWRMLRYLRATGDVMRGQGWGWEEHGRCQRPGRRCQRGWRVGAGDPSAKCMLWKH